MEWTREQDCPLNGIVFGSAVFVKAASLGKLEILQWLKEQGCPFDDRMFSRAETLGHLMY